MGRRRNAGPMSGDRTAPPSSSTSRVMIGHNRSTATQRPSPSRVAATIQPFPRGRPSVDRPGVVLLDVSEAHPRKIPTRVLGLQAHYRSARYRLGRARLNGPGARRGGGAERTGLQSITSPPPRPRSAATVCPHRGLGFPRRDGRTFDPAPLCLRAAQGLLTNT
jgi:hypothetical protein